MLISSRLIREGLSSVSVTFWKFSLGCSSADECEFLHGPMWQVFHPDAKEWVKAGSVKVPGVGAVDASPKPWLKNLSKVPHVEFEKKEHAAIAASWPVASDSQAQCVCRTDVSFVLEEMHRMVTGLVGQVEALTARNGFR